MRNHRFRAATAAAALTVTAGLAGCGGGGADPAASGSPAPSPTPSPSASATPSPSRPAVRAFTAATACDTITDAEIRTVLGATKVHRNGNGRTSCTFVADPAAPTSLLVHVELLPSATGYAEAKAAATNDSSYKTEEFGDEAFFTGFKLWVLSGDTAYTVIATTEEDLSKSALDLGVEKTAKYREIARDAGHIVSFRL